MAIERWRPWDELKETERRMEEMMRYPLMTLRRPLVWWQVPTEEVGWTPGVEMYEKDDKFVVRAELPGMKKEELDISVLGDTLTIKGERKAEAEEAKPKKLRSRSNNSYLLCPYAWNSRRKNGTRG